MTTITLCADQQSDVRFIRALNFPNWPYLPMKRKSNVKGELDGGILCDLIPLGTNRANMDKNHESLRTIHLAYWWDFATGRIKSLKEVEKKIYPTVEDMIADGWQVD